MVKRQRLFSYVEVDDKTPIQKLSISDQIRVLIKRASHDETNDLKAADAETITLLQLRANLMEFVQKSTKLIREGKHKSVTMSISNKFDPVFEEVFTSPRITNYYDVQITRPDIDYDINYFVNVRLEVKAY